MTILQGQKGARYGLWWEDPAFYTLYDDFGDASIDGSKWNSVIDGSGGTATVTESGGALNINFNTSTGNTSRIRFKSIAIPANRSIWVSTYSQTSADSAGTIVSSVQMGNDTDGWTTIYDPVAYISGNDNTSGGYHPGTINIVAHGGDVYDAWLGGDKLVTAVSKPNGCQIRFTNNPAGLTHPGSGAWENQHHLYEVRHSNA
jgi:hypothetical protein